MDLFPQDEIEDFIKLLQRVRRAEKVFMILLKTKKLIMNGDQLNKRMREEIYGDILENINECITLIEGKD